MQRILFFSGLLITVWIFASCGARTEPLKKMEPERIPVRILTLNQKQETASVPVSGQFTTDDEVMLSFKTTGIIHKIYVKEGDKIRKGQLLATLNLTEIDAALRQAQLAYEKASRDHQRLINLYNDSVATLEQVQNAKTTMDQFEQQVNTMRFNRQFSEIRSEANGFVLRKLASEGQQVSGGTAVFQTNGAGSGTWILRVGITDHQWSSIQLGNPALVGIASAATQTVRGKVTRKSEVVDPSNGLFSADITLAGDHSGKIAAGMFGKGIIQTRIHPGKENLVNGTWSVPYDALLDGDGSTGYVFVTNDNHTATRLKVTVAGMEKDHVLISRGLENARALIISGSAYLTDQSPIDIIQ